MNEKEIREAIDKKDLKKLISLAESVLAVAGKMPTKSLIEDLKKEEIVNNAYLTPE